MSFDWKGTLATVAPALATALGGPMAGMAVGMATKALGIEANEEALAEAVATGNPETLLKLREADNNFKLELKRLHVKLEEIGMEDRKSARALFSVDKRPQIILSFLFISGYFVILGALLSGQVVIQPNIKDMALVLVGLLTREVPTIMQFWFGTSSGSKDKTDAIGAIRKSIGDARARN